MSVIATTVLGLEESWGMGEKGRAKATGRVMCLLGGMEDVDNG